MISGLFAAVVFIAFGGGLAESIGAAPFICIVTVVVILMLIDFVQSVRQGLKEEKRGKG